MNWEDKASAGEASVRCTNRRTFSLGILHHEYLRVLANESANMSQDCTIYSLCAIHFVPEYCLKFVRAIASRSNVATEDAVIVAMLPRSIRSELYANAAHKADFGSAQRK